MYSHHPPPQSAPSLKSKGVSHLENASSEDIIRHENEQLRQQVAALQSKVVLYQELALVGAAVEQQAVVTITDENGAIRYVNDTFCRLSGYRQQEVIGHTHRIINSAYHPPNFFTNLYQTITKGTVWRGQMRNRAKDGTIFWVDMAITPIFDQGSKPKQYIAISHDITALKNAQLQVEHLLTQTQEANEELEASAEELRQTLEYSLDTRDQIARSAAQYRLISESMQDLICLHDRQGRFTYISPSVHTLLGYTPSELQDLLPQVLIHPEDWEQLVGEMRGWMRSKETPLPLLYRIRSKNGTFLWLETLLQTVLNEQGLVVGLHSASRDVTQRKAAEESLQLTLKELQQRNLELDHYAYRVSHDLRAPLCSIKGLTSLIALETDLGQIKQFNDMIDDRVRKSDEFISSVLAHTQTLSAPQQHIPIDLRELIEQCWQEQQYLPNWDRLHLNIEVEQQEIFYSDSFRLAMVFRNFVSNAIKYLNPAQEKSYVSFLIRITPAEARIQIRDNGIGIAPEYLPRLFEMFFRATEMSTGSGLGLYIVKQSLNQMSGRVSVESEEGKGTTFYIMLPNTPPSDTLAPVHPEP